MARRCRDCPRCTEPFVFRLVFIPLRVAHWMMTSWNVRMFQRWCPECGHRLKIHKKVGGRFVD